MQIVFESKKFARNKVRVNYMQISIRLKKKI